MSALPPQTLRGGRHGCSRIRRGSLRRVSPDDKRVIVVRGATPEGRTELVLTKNWLQEFKARAGS